jgi:hypothetical protein
MLPDELFSSWLVRAALTQGCDPLVLTGEIWGKWRIWTMDADRIHDDVVLMPISSVSGVEIARIKQSSIYQIACLIYGDSPPEKAVWPWMLALGSRNLKRRGGLQYCPLCLAEDAKPYFRKQWRYAWHTSCDKHGCNLLDRCHVCNSPIEPHRLVAENKQLAFCATCQTDLRLAHLNPALVEARLFQQKADEVLLNGSSVFQHQMLTVSEWFGLVDFFLAMYRRVNRSKTQMLANFLGLLSSALIAELPIMSGAGIELLRTHERQVWLGSVYRLMVTDKARFELAAIKSGITRQAFCERRDLLPEVLSEFYLSLPHQTKSHIAKGKRDNAQPRPKHEVIRMMGRLERKLAMAQRS